VFCASDLGSRMNAVSAVVKAVATLAQRVEIRQSSTTATEIARRAAWWAARGQTTTGEGTEPRLSFANIESGYC